MLLINLNQGQLYVAPPHQVEQGNLVNVANVMGMQAVYQNMNTSLHPDHINDGGVERQLKSLLVDKILT
jgi:hypothetical protein